MRGRLVKYIGIRVLQAIPVLFGVSVISFLLIHMVPGDPARLQLGARASAQQVAALHHQLGLDRPLIDQYGTFVSEAFHLRFGESIALHQSVGVVIGSKVGVTALLIAYSLFVGLLLTVPLGILSGVKHGRLVDHAVRIGGMTFYVMPVFWLGLVLSLIFGLELGWFPTSGYEPGLAGAFRTLTLPSVALGLVLAPLFIRTLRAGVVETLDLPFIEAARARGLGRQRVLMRHVFRNASMPTVTLVGLTVGAIASYVVVVENVFSIPGLGTELVTAVSARDFPMVQGIVVVMAVGVVAINLITDLTYAVLDPRVQL